MKKIFSLLFVFALTACVAANTPHQKYFETKQRYKEVLVGMNSYKDRCYAKKDATQPCYKIVYKADDKKHRVDKAFKTADEAFKKGDVNGYDYAMIAVNVALDNLDIFVKENTK